MIGETLMTGKEAVDRSNKGRRGAKSGAPKGVGGSHGGGYWRIFTTLFRTAFNFWEV
jgi:hypothetical protein